MVGNVLKRTLGLTLIGAAIGVLGALVAGRFLQGLLFGVLEMDVTTVSSPWGR
ncbi:MAG: hypothetical protein ACQET1_10340 [Gemmatimonadota bacterium]